MELARSDVAFRRPTPDPHLTPSRPITLLSLCFASLLAFGADAALSVGTHPKAAIASLRVSHEIALLKATAPTLREYMAGLAALEKRLATAKDYRGAIKARDERSSVEQQLARMEKEDLLLKTRESGLRSAALPDEIILMPEQATLDGVTREPGTGALTEWKKPGSKATWKLPDLPPGGYEVIIRYSCDLVEGGSLSIGEQAFSLSGTADTTLKGASEKNFGTLKITSGSGPLTITARTVLKTNLMDLHFVKLIPANH